VKYSLKKIYRTPFKSIIFIFLIGLSVTVLCLSMGMWKYSYTSLKHSKDAFTTIGILRELEFTEQTNRYSAQPKYEYGLLGHVKKAATESRYTKYADNRKYLMGYSSDVKSYTRNGSHSEFYPYPYSIVTGVCEQVDYYMNSANYSAIIKIDKDDLNILPYFVEEYNYEDVEYIDIRGLYLTSDLNFPFKVGEKYIIYTYIQSYDVSKGRLNGHIDYIKTEYAEYSEEYFLTQEEIKEHPELNREWVNRITDDSMLSCHLLESDAKTFLESGNKRWNDIVENCRITKHSLEMILTDDMNSIYSFNAGDVYLLRGRAISKEEYEHGAKVCIVNALAASISGLDIGDKISFSVYESDFMVGSKRVRSLSLGEGAEENDTEDFIAPNGYEGQDFISEIEYEIIGFYRNTGAGVRGELLLSNNVIIVPSKSIEGNFNRKPIIADLIREKDGEILRYSMERTSIPGSFSVVIENGKINEFEKEMEALGYAGMFYYFDQSYSEISEKLDGYMSTASTMLLISVLAWICVSVIFLIIYMTRSKKELATMLSLGAGRVKAFISEMTGIFIIVTIGAIAGYIAATSLYEKVIERTISTSLEGLSTSVAFYEKVNSGVLMSSNIIWQSVVIQAVILLLIAGLAEYRQSGQNVLKLMKGLTKTKNEK